ncbi:MAG: hypothetical protein P1S60_02660 [Anaerolineae bacterium]|nr:hypothetical protein [Anaerolineae bacterium]
MRWLDFVSRDPVPWLLDPINPSSRYLTLRDIFQKDKKLLNPDQEQILLWEPIKLLRAHWDPVSHWGRANAPYYGSAVGSFGTLHMLQQLGAPVFPEAQATCEALFTSGRTEQGLFIPDSHTAAWLCYTGIALQVLVHFGFAKDPRTQTTQFILVNRILQHPESLSCPMVRGECRDGLVKALNALLHLPSHQQNQDTTHAIDILGDKLVDYTYDFAGEDAEWALPRYPRYYDSDLLELCHVLSHTNHRHDARLSRIIQTLTSLQDADGKWRKLRQTHSLAIERIQQPSRWLTYEAVHTLTLVYGDDIYGPG